MPPLRRAKTSVYLTRMGFIKPPFSDWPKHSSCLGFLFLLQRYAFILIKTSFWTRKLLTYLLIHNI